MVGQGVLRECLLDSRISEVLMLSRRPSGVADVKVREIVREDLGDLQSLAPTLRGFDACFFCLGVSSAGMKEADYRRVTYDLTLGSARTLAAENPAMTFIYVSGAGTDSTEKGRSMWARVKGQTENALLRLPFKAVYLLRPGLIQPLHGIKSKTPVYRLIYAVGGPLIALLKVAAPGMVTTTERIGRAMIELATRGADERVLENREINWVALGRG